ncbi:MAG: MMPL family transporter [Chloroflexi bacterium]|nr:MMPL family transporter [Chloroflexota bacterium]
MSPINLLSTEQLARSANAHALRTVVAWLILVVIGFVLAGTLFGSATTNSQDFTYDPEAVRVKNMLEDAGLREEFTDVETVVIHHAVLTVDDPAFRVVVDRILSATNSLGDEVLGAGVTVDSYYSVLAKADLASNQAIKSLMVAGAEFLVSTDRHSTLLRVPLDGDSDKVTANVPELLDIASTSNTDGFDIGVAGIAAIGADFQEVSEKDLRIGETIGITVALFILLLVFRALGSVWIPLVIAIFAIVLAVATSAVIGQFYKLSFFVINMITMIGLAVGIDYSLFIVARFREERENGLTVSDAVIRSGSTASRAVFFSGVTVILALIGMLIVPTTIFFSLGLGAILAVIFAIVLSLTLIPAILTLMGDRVNSLRLPCISGRSTGYSENGGGFWGWITRAVLRRPVWFFLGATALLVAATIPYFSITLGFNGPDTLPDKFSSKRAFQRLISDFSSSGAQISPVDILVIGDTNNEAAFRRLNEEIAGIAALGNALPVKIADDGSLAVIQYPLTVAAASDEANAAIRELRKRVVDNVGFNSEVLVGGETAFNVDFFNLVDTWTPIVITFVLALSFVLLTIVFRSLIVPVKAIMLNLLSVGAAYGLLVLVFEKGIGNDILGFQQVDVIEAWIPLFLFSILFGLSMDYEVFLLSRIRERYDAGASNVQSIAFGLRSTAGIITGAALIMVAVFGGFALGDLVMFQQFGFGLGVAVLVDATIIRSLLVPSTMKLLGDNNWYLPSWLSWLPDMRVEAK